MHLTIDLSRLDPRTAHAVVTIMSLMDGHASECSLEDIASAIEHLRLILAHEGVSLLLPPSESKDVQSFITGLIRLGEVWDK